MVVEKTGDVTTKVGVMIGLFRLGIFGGLMPKFVSADRNETLLSISNCGSGGVLLVLL